MRGYFPLWGPDDNHFVIAERFGNNIATAAAYLTAGQVLVITMDTEDLDSDVTISNPIFFAGGKINRTAGGVLHIASRIDAPDVQIFGDTANDWVVFDNPSNPTVKPEWFGAVGDGSNDDTAYMFRTVAAMCSGQTLQITRTYKMTGAITLTATDKNINIDCLPSGLISALTSTADPCIDLTGSLNTWYQLGGNIAKLDRNITVHATLAASLSPGDLIWVTTNSGYGGSGELWDDSVSGAYKGEFCEVYSVSGTTVTLKNNCVDSYTAANTVTCLMNTVTCRVTNLRMESSNTLLTNGLRIRWGRDIIIDGVDVHGFSYSCVFPMYCYNTVIYDISAYDCYRQVADGVGYAVNIASCQIITVRGSKLLGGKHALNLGGWEPCRFVDVYNNILDNHQDSDFGCLESHANSEFVNWHDNDCYAMILSNGRNIDIRNNTVRARQGGANFHLIRHSATGAATVDYINITGNRLIGGANSGNGIEVGIGNQTVKRLNISNNVGDSSAYAINIRRSSTNPLSIQQLTIKNNDLNCGSIGCFISGYNVDNYINIVKCDITGNNGDVENAMVYFYRATVEKLSINNNNFTQIGTTSDYFFRCNSTSIDTLFCNGNVLQCTEYINYVYLLANKFIQCKDNYISGVDAAGFNLTAPLINYANNTFFGAKGPATISGQMYTEMLPNGAYRSQLSAVPTTGTWPKGSIVMLTAPSVGDAPGNICTTSGTFTNYSDAGGVTTSGSPIVSGLTDTSVLHICDLVNVDAGFATTGPFKILDKTATTLTLDTNSNGTGSSRTVSTSDPDWMEMGRSDMETLLTATIANGESLSDVITIPNGCKYFQIHLPAAWTPADLAFRSSPTVGGTYGNLVTEANVRVVFTVTAGNTIGVDFSAPNLAASRFLKLESVTVGTSGTPVNQGAERVIYISTKS